MIYALLVIAAVRVEVVESEAVSEKLARDLVVRVEQATSNVAPREAPLRIALRLIGGATRVLMVLEGFEGSRSIGRVEITEAPASPAWNDRIAAAVARLFPNLQPREEKPAEKPIVRATAPPAPRETGAPIMELALLTGGAVAAGVSIAFTVQAESERSDLEQRTLVDNDYRAIENSLATNRTAAAVLLGTSAVLVLASVAWAIFN